MSRYIDTDALKKRMLAVFEDDGIGVVLNGYWSSKLVREIIDEQPTADVVKVVHGEWHPRTDLPKQEIFICSVCGGWAYSPWIGNRKNPKPNWCKYKYCPNCGADMREEA